MEGLEWYKKENAREKVNKNAYYPSVAYKIRVLAHFFTQVFYLRFVNLHNFIAFFIDKKYKYRKITNIFIHLQAITIKIACFTLILLLSLLKYQKRVQISSISPFSRTCQAIAFKTSLLHVFD